MHPINEYAIEAEVAYQHERVARDVRSGRRFGRRHLRRDRVEVVPPYGDVRA